MLKFPSNDKILFVLLYPLRTIFCANLTSLKESFAFPIICFITIVLYRMLLIQLED